MPETLKIRPTPVIACYQGRPSPRGNDAFTPLFQDFPFVPKNLSDSVENVCDFTFSDKIFRFSSAKISDDLFSLFPYFRKISHSLFFLNSPLFRKISLVFTYFL